jgi:Domain of unknown function (DUF4173)
MSIATTSDFEIAPARPLVTPLVFAAGCVAIADWLFYGWDIGISLALFLGVFGVVAIASNRVVAPHKTQIAMTAIFVAGLVAAIEDVDFLSVVVSTLATVLFVIVVTDRETSSWQRRLFEALTIPFRGPLQLARELFDALRNMKAWTLGWLGSLAAWIVPLSIFGVFLSLLSAANPLIERRLMQIDLHFLLNIPDVRRIWSWVWVACLIWPVIHRRNKPKPVRKPEHNFAAALPSAPDYLLGVQAMSRSLILFNALFVLQTALDLTYLWGGANLPDGMNYADYAHRGAYPLIATALLAAGFVLIAMRPGGPAEHSRLIRPLVLLWIGQNILLVISSIFRLDLYVAAYSLTYLRLAAFIWMGLVAAGLLLILIQIVLKKPNSWLINANAATLALVLYGCCFINAPQIIASYNIEHSRELSGTGPSLDLIYLAGLGPQALPVLEAHIRQIPVLGPITRDRRNCWDHALSRHPANWRGWGFRAWRLQRYLANNPNIAPPLLDGGQG